MIYTVAKVFLYYKARNGASFSDSLVLLRGN